MDERIFAIGDLHGCLEHLDRMMDTIPFDPRSDRLVFMGDYIDRGPDPFGVVERVLTLVERYPRTVCLRGNHEQMLLDYLSGSDPYSFLYNGGESTIRSYEQAGRGNAWPGLLPPSHEAFFENLPFYWEAGEYLFVHAGLRPGVPLEKQDPLDMLWIRQEFYESPANFGKTVVFGHTPFRKPFVRAGKIGIDTGAVYGNRLTCVELPVERFYQV